MRGCSRTNISIYILMDKSIHLKMCQASSATVHGVAVTRSSDSRFLRLNRHLLRRRRTSMPIRLLLHTSSTQRSAIPAAKALFLPFAAMTMHAPHHGNDDRQREWNHCNTTEKVYCDLLRSVCTLTRTKVN